MVSNGWRGACLRQVMNEEESLLRERAVGMVLQICDALDYIHGQGVVPSRSEARKHHGGRGRPHQAHRFRYRFKAGARA